MDFNDELNACAALVEKGDPLRFRTVMAAPVAARAKLFPLYAFNVEVARAPWVTQEAMIAEMRLQWWRDALEEIAEEAPNRGTDRKKVRRHEVVTPLAAILDGETAKMLDTLVAARRWDIYKDAFEDAAHFERYIDETAGHLMVAAARSLGGPADESTLRDAGFASGLAAWFRAIPKLEAAKRIPLVDGRVEAVADLAQAGLTRYKQARAKKAGISSAAVPAVWPALQAPAVLKMVARDPMLVSEGLPETPRDGLWWAALRGRW